MTQAQPPAVAVQDAASLTQFIETRFHATHRSQFPELLRLAEKVERVHGNDPQVPAGLATLLVHMTQDLDAHMCKEEAVLFPAIREGGMPGIEHPIAVMRADHAGHEGDISELRKLTNNLSLPPGACRSWTALYEGLGQFIADLEEHMRIENDMLFPQFERAHRHEGRGCTCQGHD